MIVEYESPICAAVPKCHVRDFAPCYKNRVGQSHAAPPNQYTLGSRARSLFRFSCLLLPSLGTLAVLYLVILHLIRGVLGDGPENVFFAVTLLAGGIFVALAEALVLRRIPVWLASAIRDSAAGFVDNVGLRYRLLLRWRAVPWENISRIEYFGQNDGRIHVYIFGSPFPVRFGPTHQTGSTLALPDFLKSQMQVLNRSFIEHRISSHQGSGTLNSLDEKRNENRALIAQTLVLFSVLMWLGSVSVLHYYSYTRPRLPDASKGRIFVQNDRGYKTYLTGNEKYILYLLEFVAPSLFLAGTLLYPKRRIAQRSKS